MPGGGKRPHDPGRNEGKGKHAAASERGVARARVRAPLRGWARSPPHPRPHGTPRQPRLVHPGRLCGQHATMWQEQHAPRASGTAAALIPPELLDDIVRHRPNASQR